MDCNQIRKVAANALITCNIHSFPIDCFAILKQYGFRVYSYLVLSSKRRSQSFITYAFPTLRMHFV